MEYFFRNFFGCFVVAVTCYLSLHRVEAKTDFWVVGCFKDPRGNDFDGDAFSEADMQHNMCVTNCMERNFKYMGLQASASGDEATCRCGNTFGKSGVVESCAYTCPGNPRQKCGGQGVNTVLYGFVVVEPASGLADSLSMLITVSLATLTVVMLIGTIFLVQKTIKRY